MTKYKQIVQFSTDGFGPVKRSGGYSRPASRAQREREEYAKVKAKAIQSAPKPTVQETNQKTTVRQVAPQVSESVSVLPQAAPSQTTQVSPPPQPSAAPVSNVDPIQPPTESAAAPTQHSVTVKQSALQTEQAQPFSPPHQKEPTAVAKPIVHKTAVKPYKPKKTAAIQVAHEASHQQSLTEVSREKVAELKSKLPKFIDPNPITEISPHSLLSKVTIPNPLGWQRQQIINGLSAGLLLFSSIFGFQAYSLNSQLKEEIKILGVQSVQTGGIVAAPNAVQNQNSPDAPSEEKPNANALSNHYVVDDAPRYLKIPKFGITARIFTVGETSDGAVDVPRNVHDVGWYNKSDTINDSRGAAFLVGHVSGFTTDGVFARINQLEPGDEIIIERGDGSEITFDMFAQESYDANNVDMQRALSPSDEHASRLNLNLMTCSGNYNADDQSFDERLLVSAKKL